MKITICVPTFNRADLLDQTLRSIVLQTVKPFEVLIIDNASTDNTDQIVKKYRKFGFKYIKNRANIGMVKNWNKAILLAKGDYLTFLHSDDLISPSWYKHWTSVIEKNPCKFYTSAFAIIDIQNKPLYVCHPFMTNRGIKNKNVFNEFMHHLSPQLPPTAASLYHKSLFDEIGLFDPKFQTEADVDFCHRIFFKYDVYYSDNINFAYRSHRKQGYDRKSSAKNLDIELKRFYNYLRIIRHEYKMYFNNTDKNRYFILVPTFMTLCPISLYLLKLDIKKVLGYFKIARQIFPDLFKSLKDWIWFSKIEYRFIQRVLFDRFISRKDINQLLWLKQIKGR